MRSEPVVRARGVRKTFGDVVALDGVDLDVTAGQIHGLIGPNGAGKTTLLGLMLHLALPDAGTLEILGTPVSRTLAIPNGVAGFVDGPGLYPALTARQNLSALLRLRGEQHRDCRSDVDAALEQVGLAEVADDRVRGFSLGMRQRLGLAAALLARPRLLVLDEPANGLDPAGARLVHQVLSRLAGEGTSIVLSSHRMDELAVLCTDVSVLSTGRLVFSGSVAKLAAEVGELDYRLRVSDAQGARRVAATIPGLVIAPDDALPLRQDPDSVVVRGAVQAMDELIPALVREHVAVREFAPVVSPLEAAFLALTDTGSIEDAR